MKPTYEELETALAETRRERDSLEVQLNEEITSRIEWMEIAQRRADDLARTREELANEKGQWELEANNAGRLATALAEARRQLEDRDGPDEAIEAMRAATDRLRAALVNFIKLAGNYPSEDCGSLLFSEKKAVEIAKRALVEGGES